MEEPLSRRERKKQETQLRLVQAALRLFREYGYDETTVEQIAEAADVAKGTFFNYFATKEAILPALAEWRLRQLERALLPEAGGPASPVARIKLALCLIAEDPLMDPPLARRLFVALAQNGQEDSHPGQSLMRLLVEEVGQAQAAGEIRGDLDPVCVGGVVRALLFQQMMMWNCGYRPYPLPSMLSAAVDMLMDGLAGPAWRRPS